jgi:transposase InsO family protein
VLLPVAGRRCFTVHVGRPSNEGGSCGHHQAVQAAGEKESGLKLQVLRTDNGDEFTTAEFAAYCADEGIQRHYSAPYLSQQNGVAER